MSWWRALSPAHCRHVADPESVPVLLSWSRGWPFPMCRFKYFCAFKYFFEDLSKWESCLHPIRRRARYILPTSSHVLPTTTWALPSLSLPLHAGGWAPSITCWPLPTSSTNLGSPFVFRLNPLHVVLWDCLNCSRGGNIRRPQDQSPGLP